MQNSAIWCSVHQPSEEQIKEIESKGFTFYTLLIIDSELQDKLSNTPGSYNECYELAGELLRKYGKHQLVQVGGSMLFQFALGQRFEMLNFINRPLYAHSERISEDIPQEDGSVKIPEVLQKYMNGLKVIPVIK